MKLSDIMSEMGLAIYAEAALVIFVGVFLAVAYRLFRSQSSAELEAVSRLPLEESGVPAPVSREKDHE